MGIFEIFKPKRKTPEFEEPDRHSVVKQAAESYLQILKAGDKAVGDLHGVWEGLGERDTMVLHAADDGLIPTPPHLTIHLQALQVIKAQHEKLLAEAGIDPREVVARMGDNEAAAFALLERQSWWPESVASMRAEMGIRTADDIGCWRNAWKRLVPYIYEVGRMYQTPDDYRQSGRLAQWMWRVDLAAGTVQSAVAYECDQLVSRLADGMIGLSFAMWDQREQITERVQDRDSINWSVVALEYMIFFQHMLDRSAFAQYGPEFREHVMEMLDGPLVRKFAEVAAVRPDKLEEYRDMFIDALNERTAEYANYKVDAIADDSAAARQGDLLWEFGKRIATLVGATHPQHMAEYVRFMAVTGLAVLELPKQLKELKELIV